MSLISVVVPVYNSASSLEALITRIHQSFQNNENESELILVDDFSSDGSWSKLLELKNQYKDWIKIVRLSRNYGQHSATFCGLRHSSGDLVITIDDDLQNSPEDILNLVKRQELSQAKLVYGVGEKQHSFWRKFASKVVRTGNRRLEGGPHQGSSFRLMTRDLADELLQHNRHFIFLDEVLFWYTNDISFESVTHHKREKGKSGYSLRKLVGLVTKSTLFYSTWPLKLMTLGGLLLSLLSFIVGVYFIGLKFFYDVPVPGFTALIVTILFSTSLVLLCFGIIGSYIKHMYTLLNNKPMFSIAEKHI